MKGCGHVLHLGLAGHGPRCPDLLGLPSMEAPETQAAGLRLSSLGGAGSGTVSGPFRKPSRGEVDRDE